VAEINWRPSPKFILRRSVIVPGWEDKPTKKPTAFMMTTKFANISVVKIRDRRKTAYPLRPLHFEYLRALNLDPDIFTNP